MKRILAILVGLVLITFLYYLFIRPYEFEANFKAKTLPGDLIETIRIWTRATDSIKIIEIDSFSGLRQTILVERRKYIYDWRFTIINDSLTKVNIRISELNRSLVNKLLIPFTDQKIETDAYEIVNRFYEILKSHLAITKIKLIGKVEIDSAFCVCRSLETSQIEKANGMMRDFSLITSFIDSYKLKVNGPPMIRIQEWNHKSGYLKFDFCFPIYHHDTLPVVESLSYKKFKREIVLKAEYRGNYITSDRAWYSLLRYAQVNNYRIKNRPIEYFNDNPTLGMNETNWRADIYLPLEEN